MPNNEECYWGVVGHFVSQKTWRVWIDRRTGHSSGTKQPSQFCICNLLPMRKHESQVSSLQLWNIALPHPNAQTSRSMTSHKRILRKEGQVAVSHPHKQSWPWRFTEMINTCEVVVLISSQQSPTEPESTASAPRPPLLRKSAKDSKRCLLLALIMPVMTFPSASTCLAGWPASGPARGCTSMTKSALDSRKNWLNPSLSCKEQYMTWAFV